MGIKKLSLKKIIWAVVWILPFILGVFGYFAEGIPFGDALYDSFALYMVSPMTDVDNWMITAAKWMAPFVLAGGILLAIKGMIERLKETWIEMSRDATAVYSDQEYAEIISKNLRRGILVRDEAVRNVDAHILFFSDDKKNLAFYHKNKTMFQDKKVYIGVVETDSFLLRENTAFFFNLNEIIARTYWRKHHLLSCFENGKTTVKIAITGFGGLGKSLLNYGLLYNIYDLNQQIEYHIWGDSRLYRYSREGTDFMNRDRIIYHEKSWREDILVLARADRIILAEELQTELIQTLLYLNADADIYCFNPGSVLLDDIYKSEHIHSFGMYNEILTESNIKGDSLYRAAKELNYRYACLYSGITDIPEKKEEQMELLWAQLDGFTRGSNIASADYHEIRKLLMTDIRNRQKELSTETLGQMEHIRWCRFHLLNYWTYGTPENGKNKDSDRRIHTCLVPFERLSAEEKEKDYEAVRLLLELMPIETAEESVSLL